MGFVGGQELILILIIVVLLFGAKKIPELAKGLGLGIKEFKKASKAVQDETTDKTESIQDGSSKNT
ncbi:MAG: twin-arginine translocase TatA/TatE family subunit [Fibrobacter sp.]|nr:twin-arginine translocase TatA/TatE family subunit [Fibrobacter sp.]